MPDQQIDPEQFGSASSQAPSQVAYPSHVEIDLRDPDERAESDLGPWLSADANLLNASAAKLAVRRALDISVAIVGSILLLPLFVTTAIAVKTTSRGPVFFRQSRVGQHGVEFVFYKFRSMKSCAEDVRGDLLGNNECVGPIFKMRQDPRMTRVGRWIRRASIDELPQLWHVLKGDMSLVGPRPPLTTEVAEYGEWEHQRLTVKPGITCIWQVSGRSDLDFDTWVSMDIEYVENWSLWLDLSLLLRTIPAVLTGKGAY